MTCNQILQQQGLAYPRTCRQCEFGPCNNQPKGNSVSHIKNYMGFSLDFSASMGRITEAAAKDYNINIATIKEEAIAQSQDTIVSVIKCGTGRPARNEFLIQNASVTALKPLGTGEYKADGSATPLFDSVMELITQFKKVPDVNDQMVSFLIMVTTDGDDNASRTSGRTLSAEIKRLQATDRWTFVFRVPRGNARSTLINHGIPADNILEWDLTSKGVEVATQATTTAMRGFYEARSKGVKSTQSFYTDLSKVSVKEVKANLEDISQEVSIWKVLPSEDGDQIKDFCDRRLGGGRFVKGAAFYELVKPERKVQDYKKIVIKDKKSGMIYGGDAARQLLGLPFVGDVKLLPGDHGKFVVFIQSTSLNRKLPEGSSVLYWPAGV